MRVCDLTLILYLIQFLVHIDHLQELVNCIILSLEKVVSRDHAESLLNFENLSVFVALNQHEIFDAETVEIISGAMLLCIDVVEICWA